MDKRKPFRDAILEDEDIQLLLERLAISEGFHAVMVMCEMPRVANTVVDILNTELPPLREQPIHLVRIDPYRAHKKILAPIPLDLLIDEVLASLVHPPAENQGPSVVTVVDASRALPQDDESWGILFQRMNERRNAIGRALASALVFVVPKRQEVLFARAAPDFWSILGVSIIVQTPPIEDDVGLMVAWEDPLKQENDPAAMQHFDESTNLIKGQLEKNDNPVVMALAAELHLIHGAKHALRAQFPAAIRDLERSIQLSQRLIALDPNRIEPMAHLASALFTLGKVYSQMGNIDAAIDAFTKSIVHWRQLMIVADESMNTPMDLARALARLGDAYRINGDLGRALVSYDEAAEIDRHRLTGNPRNLLALRRLVLVLGKTCRAYVIQGDLDRCRAIAEEGIGAAQKWLDAEPSDIDARRHLGRFHSLIATIHKQRGESAEAATHYHSALATLEPLLTGPSPDPVSMQLAEQIRTRLQQ